MNHVMQELNKSEEMEAKDKIQMKANVYAQVLSFTSHKVIREVEMGDVDRIDKRTIKREKQSL